MAKTEAQINKELREYIQLLTGLYDIFAVVLYGSYAQGKAKDTSDITEIRVKLDIKGKIPRDLMRSL